MFVPTALYSVQRGGMRCGRGTFDFVFSRTTTPFVCYADLRSLQVIRACAPLLQSSIARKKHDGRLLPLSFSHSLGVCSKGSEEVRKTTHLVCAEQAQVSRDCTQHDIYNWCGPDRVLSFSLNGGKRKGEDQYQF
ncbi:hypothetical protein IscW_ISCW016557 [Ixodes scapularis]|uniref:Uncharacterized protein n=1 Tax=Ixodes scapularis TaxID=6945 RepID=B7P733_IXOSC|nr:hypothetical protein IscW_ISCW016557 [Ixodes scapularis]|eukprot:XP_002409521.1 hypothetical protein IscW_ISCW016557 [Ixodes scapularis]